MATNKTAAIKHARECVGEIYKFGDGYRFLMKDLNISAWRDGRTGSYNYVKHWRSQALIDRALNFMGDCRFVPYEGGRWVDYLDEID